MIVITTSRGLFINFQLVEEGMCYGLTKYLDGFIVAFRTKFGTRFSFYNNGVKYMTFLTEKIGDIHDITFWDNKIWACDTANDRVATVNLDTLEVKDSGFGKFEHVNSILFDDDFYVTELKGNLHKIGGNTLEIHRGIHSLVKSPDGMALCSSDHDLILTIRGMEVVSRKAVGFPSCHVRGLCFNPDLVGLSKKGKRDSRHIGFSFVLVEGELRVMECGQVCAILKIPCGDI